MTDLDYAFEFQAGFGMRCVGLEDATQAVYNAYRVPDPQAPYPQDYIIDQAGIVRYWSDEYEPQEIHAVLESLLGLPAAAPESTVKLAWVRAEPNPFFDQVRLTLLGGNESARSEIEVISPQGRRVVRLPGAEGFGAGSPAVWDGRDAEGRVVPTGVYFIRLADLPGAATERLVRIRR